MGDRMEEVGDSLTDGRGSVYLSASVALSCKMHHCVSASMSSSVSVWLSFCLSVRLPPCMSESSVESSSSDVVESGFRVLLNLRLEPVHDTFISSGEGRRHVSLSISVYLSPYLSPFPHLFL